MSDAFFKPRKTKEKTIESHFKKRMREEGGKAYKWVHPGRRGANDQLAVMNGHTEFVECKRPGEKPRKIQTHFHQELAELGAIVRTVSTKEEVEEYIVGLKERAGC